MESFRLEKILTTHQGCVEDVVYSSNIGFRIHIHGISGIASKLLQGAGSDFTAEELLAEINCVSFGDLPS